jgi:hypothetical protein
MHVLNHENIMKNTTLEDHFAHELGNVAFQQPVFSIMLQFLGFNHKGCVNRVSFFCQERV